MPFSKPASGVIFAEEKIEEEFNSLQEGSWLKKSINKAIADFKQNSIITDNFEIVVRIIEYFDHKNYERRFKY